MTSIAASPTGRLDRPLSRGLRLFGLQTEHVHLVGLCALLLFLIRTGDVLVANVAETLFVKRVGPELLPIAFAAEGVALLVGLNYVGAAVDRGRRTETLRALLIAAVAGPLVLRLLLATESPYAIGAAFVFAEAMAIALAFAVGVLLSDVVPGAEVRQVAAPVVAAGFLGEAFGSLISVALAGSIGIENVVLVASFAALGASFALARIANRMLIRLDVLRAPKLSAPDAGAALRRARSITGEAIEVSRRSKLLRYLLATTGLTAIIAPFVALQFHATANLTFETEVDLLLFYALLKAMLALVAIGLQLLAFRWLRRQAGVASTFLVLPLGSVASLALLWAGGGVALAALVWTMLRLGARAVDEPARGFLHELFPADVRERVDWLVNRNARALAFVLGSLLLAATYHWLDPASVVPIATVIAVVWLITAMLFRLRYGELVISTSLMSRVDFDQLRPEDVSTFLDRDAVRQLEREVVSGVPARAQLAIELLRQVRAPRLPLILAASYGRQPPVLRPHFLTSLAQSLRDAPPGHPVARPTLLALARLARTRLSDSERAVLVRIFGEAAGRHSLDLKDAGDILDQIGLDEPLPVRLAVAGARVRCGIPTDQSDSDAAFDVLLDAALASPHEQEIHLAIDEIEDLVRSDPGGRGHLLARYPVLIDTAGGLSVRSRAYVVASAARIRDLLTDSDVIQSIDARVVPLALNEDPRLAAAALEYMKHERFLPLLETHVLPNLTAGNHRVREYAAEVARFFGPVAVPALLDAVRSGSRRERIASARLLGSYPMARVAHRVLIAEEMEGLERQLAQVHMLRSLEQPAAYALLASRLEEEANEHVRAILRLLYAESGDETLIRIERQLWSRDHTLRAAAIEALDHVVRAVPEARELRSMIDDSSLALRANRAHRAIRDLPTTTADLLRRTARGGNWVTRLIACHTIAASRSIDLTDVLVDVSRAQRQALRAEAERALAVLSSESLPEGATMTTVERMLLLKETELFRNLDARDLAGIAGVLKEARFEPGQPIMREGDRGDFLAIITTGVVDIIKNDGKGGTFHIRTLAAPEVMGEIALLEEGPRTASVMAKERCHVVTLSRGEFEAVIEEYPGVALGIARVLSRRLLAANAAAAKK